MGMTRDVQKALGPAFPGSTWNPDPPKNTQLWCQPGLSEPLPSMPPSRVTVGVKRDTTQQQVTKKPSLLPPALRPLPPGSGLSPAAHPCQAPHPMADPPARKASSDQGRAPVSPYSAKGSPLTPCVGAFSRPQGKKESISTRPRCLSLGRRACMGLSVGALSAVQTCSFCFFTDVFSGKPCVEPKAMGRAMVSDAPAPLSPSQLLSSQQCGPV